MIIDKEKFNSRYFAKPYLVYLVTECEMGSEGQSGWIYYAICHGNTDEEIYNDWIEQCKTLYGVDLSSDLKCYNGHWSCYYDLAKNELPVSIYGHAQPLFIPKSYLIHED